MRSGSIMKGQTNDDRKKLIENAMIRAIRRNKAGPKGKAALAINIILPVFAIMIHVEQRNWLMKLG